MDSHVPSRDASRSIRPEVGQPATGINITAHVRTLCTDIAARLPELRHVEPPRIAFSFSQTRKRSPYGLWASMTPMRFQGGAVTEVRNGHRYAFPRLYGPDGCELLYILTVYLPRFLNLGFHDKLVTIFHELWHISPSFDGDLRRHGGRCYAHTHSQEKYDAVVGDLAARWLALGPPESTYDFLRWTFIELTRRYGRVYGTRVPHPKLIRVG